MVKLSIPYRSQWAGDAVNHNADCGPTCVAMILNYRGVSISPDGVYDYIDTPKGPEDYTTFTELILATRANGAKLNWRQHKNREDAFNNLRANLDAGNPAIVLVKYLPWRPVLGNKFDFGHFVVATGYDEAADGTGHIYMHDPLFGLWVSADKGAHYPMPYDLFAAGWGTASQDSNPDWTLAYNGDVVEAGSVPAPKPKPEPKPIPVPTPTPPVTTAPGKTMDDINRRIRALAAYRWAEPPNFDDPAGVKIWLDHLGDFGLAYDEYTVQAGDSLSGLALKYYGEFNRWPAVKAYNNLQRNGLWLGETLLIPRLGQSGAQNDPALPHDTADFSSAMESLDNPELESQDYNALVGESSKGIGFVDLPDA
jgi:nucleoid-associated protein YgaU